MILTPELIRQTNKQLAYEFINERLCEEALTDENVNKLAALLEEIEPIHTVRH